MSNPKLNPRGAKIASDMEDFIVEAANRKRIEELEAQLVSSERLRGDAIMDMALQHIRAERAEGQVAKLRGALEHVERVGGSDFGWWCTGCKADADYDPLGHDADCAWAVIDAVLAENKEVP